MIFRTYYSTNGIRESYTIEYSEDQSKTYELNTKGKVVGRIEVSDYQGKGITIDKNYIKNNNSLDYSHKFNFNENGNIDGLEEYFDFDTHNGTEKWWNDGNLIYECSTEILNYRKH